MLISWLLYFNQMIFEHVFYYIVLLIAVLHGICEVSYHHFELIHLLIDYEKILEFL